MSTPPGKDDFDVAVLLPCRNQAASIGAVVSGFAKALPGARIYVFDNNSTDDTARAATLAGARVYREAAPGKENVVRRMFADIEADIYVLADGDGSCDPADASSLVNALVTERADMAVGTRAGAARGGEASFAARLIDRLWHKSLGVSFVDAASGYRAFTRRFVKSFPAISTGLDIETELSVHAGQLMIPVAEIDLSDDAAPAGNGAENASRSRLDGFGRFALLMKETQPLAAFFAFAVLFWIAGLMLAAPGVAGWTTDALAATGLFIIGFVVAACGLVLESLNRSRVEQKRILFLAVPALGAR